MLAPSTPISSPLPKRNLPPNIFLCQASSEGSRYKLKASDWVRIGKGTQSLFPRIPTSAISTDPFTKPSSAKHQEAACPAHVLSQCRARQSKNPVHNSLRVRHGGSGSNATTEVLVESTFRQLVREF
ncbi:hypothetical protein FKW44_009412 [Caligus rogercresseyi]|uniref:Uncharacterized protein n=1 Tax=Caligus rogercresseyi TaxID=217165 RepID=A0A7T8HF82_CALRO|nr:hypothetical protein FKW44_009412 [Caligus rogercresseyi]